MKKIIIAPDKFKGSLTSLEICNAINKGIKSISPETHIDYCPLADGGDGTIDVLKFHLGGNLTTTQVNDPLGRLINACYLLSKKRRIAYIEMAAASGISLLKPNELNPMQTSTFGTGQLIMDAIKQDTQHIIIGIGGSATNDAGLGMARALGYRFYDCHNNELPGCGEDLNKILHIDQSNVPSSISKIKFEVLCDVDNPFYGPRGAAYVYARQKGATPSDIERLNDGLIHFNKLIREYQHIDLQEISGSGAAGGMGGGCIFFLNASLNSGIESIKEIAQFKEKIRDVNWVITGEGLLDEQTLHGKVISGIIKEVTNQKVAIFCGQNNLNKQVLNKMPIHHLSVMMDKAQSLEDSIKNAWLYLEEAAKQFASQHLSIPQKRP